MKKLLLILSLAFGLVLTSCDNSSSGGGGGGSSSTLGITTSTATQISDYGFIAGGDLTNHTTQNIIEVGVCISRTPTPSYDDLTNTEIHPAYLDDDDSFSCYITGLSSGTQYYYRAYVVYGSESKPQVKQGSIKNVTTSGETSPIRVTTYYGYIENYYGYYLYTGGNVEILSGSPYIQQRGICYSKYNSSPTYYDDYTYSCGSGAGEFDATIGTLSGNSTYHYRAYAIYNNGEVEYGMTYHASTGSKTGSY